jgi:hypothetical protein
MARWIVGSATTLFAVVDISRNSLRAILRARWLYSSGRARGIKALDVCYLGDQAINFRDAIGDLESDHERDWWGSSGEWCRGGRFELVRGSSRFLGRRVAVALRAGATQREQKGSTSSLLMRRTL